jgi:Protein of unknown function (DUF1549)/Protein of unknown function (DUF1553)
VTVLPRITPWLPAALTVLAFASLASAGEKPAKKTTPTADAAGLTRQIDTALNARLAAEKVTPSPRCDDAEFVRRVYLDLTGVIPPADKVAAFLDRSEPDKRPKLIDELLASPGYGRHFADVWQTLMVKHDPDNRGLSFDPFTKWLEEGFNENKPWDKMVTEILTSTGTQEENGATTFFLANQTIDKTTDTVSRVFLGVQLQCAQCHNHPFTKWKQDEYWGMANFFVKVRSDNTKKAAKDGSSPGVLEAEKGKGKLPESYKDVPAKFFQGEQPKLNRSEPYRPVFAAWLTSADNPFFARALVNRVWAQFFARGFVSPVDDIHDGNPASHPELFQAMTKEFAAGGFDVKNLIRAICNSEAYQRTSKPAAGNEEADPRLFSRAAVRPLTPEQLFDSLETVLGKTAKADVPKNAGKKNPANTPRAQFVAFFAGDDNADPTDYTQGIPQALRLMNSPQMNNAAVVRQMVKATDPVEKNVERLFMATLARRPTAEEMKKFTAHVERNKADGYGDVFWALLNSSEFTLNH